MTSDSEALSQFFLWCRVYLCFRWYYPVRIRGVIKVWHSSRRIVKQLQATSVITCFEASRWRSATTGRHFQGPQTRPSGFLLSECWCSWGGTQPKHHLLIPATVMITFCQLEYPSNGRSLSRIAHIACVISAALFKSRYFFPPTWVTPLYIMIVKLIGFTSVRPCSSH